MTEPSMIHPDVVRYGTQVPMRQYVLAPLCLINAALIGQLSGYD